MKDTYACGHTVERVGGIMIDTAVKGSCADCKKRNHVEMRLDFSVPVAPEALQRFVEHAFISKDHRDDIEAVMGWVKGARACEPGETLPDFSKAGQHTVWVTWEWIDTPHARLMRDLQELARGKPAHLVLAPVGAVGADGRAYRIGATLVPRARLP